MNDTQRPGSRLLSIEELRQEVRVSRRTIERLMDEGILKRVKIRARTFITRESLDRFIQKGGSRS